jgi:hypothetical protein
MNSLPPKRINWLLSLSLLVHRALYLLHLSLTLSVQKKIKQRLIVVVKTARKMYSTSRCNVYLNFPSFSLTHPLIANGIMKRVSQTKPDPVYLSQVYFHNASSNCVLVLIHGLSDDKRVWEPLLPYLTPHFSIFYVDLRGHGLSPVTNGPK